MDRGTKRALEVATPRNYPRNAVDGIFEKACSESKPDSNLETLRMYEDHPHLRSSATFQFLHFAVVSSIRGQNDGIYPQMLGMGLRDDNDYSEYEMFDGESLRIIDVDVVDATNKLFQTRILLKDGYYDPECEYDSGCFGKVYDRANGFIEIAYIDSLGSGLEPPDFIAEDGVDASFSNHPHLELLLELRASRGPYYPGRCYCQFTAILKLALELNSGRILNAPASATRLMRVMLCLLANPNSIANASNVIVRVLCAEDIPQQIIAEFAGGHYPVADRNDELELLLDNKFLLMSAVRLHNSGKCMDAIIAFQLWVRIKFDSDSIEDFSLSYSCDEFFEGIYHGSIDLNKHFHKCVAFAKHHTVGLTENDRFWEWIQQHSKVAKNFQQDFNDEKQKVLEKEIKNLKKHLLEEEKQLLDTKNKIINP